MDALILSCGTGGGHNTAGIALKQELTARGHHAALVDPNSLRGERASSTVNNAYISLAQRAPRAFGFVYSLGNAYRRLPVRSPVYYANRALVPDLQKYLDENPCDVIVTTHLFPAEIITNMRRRGISVPPTVFIATDYTCIPFTEETDCDVYVIPSPELTDEFVDRGIPRERIAPLGIPVRREFANAPGRAECRAKIGMAKDALAALVAGGSIGAGSLEDAVGALLEMPDLRVVVICGSNASLRASLLHGFGDRCTILDSTPHMAEYMRACDLVVSKPGGLSSTEAANLGTRLVHMTPIPGCETRNMEFFASRGMCIPVTDPKRELLPACETLLDPAAGERMMESQLHGIPHAAAESICGLLESLNTRVSRRDAVG